MNFKNALKSELQKYISDCREAEKLEIESCIEEIKQKIEESLDDRILYLIKENIADWVSGERLLFKIETTIFGDNDNTIETAYSKLFSIQVFVKGSAKYTFEDDWHKIIVKAILDHFGRDNAVSKCKCGDIEAYEFVR